MAMYVTNKRLVAIKEKAFGFFEAACAMTTPMEVTTFHIFRCREGAFPFPAAGIAPPSSRPLRFRSSKSNRSIGSIPLASAAWFRVAVGSGDFIITSSSWSSCCLWLLERGNGASASSFGVQVMSVALLIVVQNKRSNKPTRTVYLGLNTLLFLFRARHETLILYLDCRWT